MRRIVIWLASTVTIVVLLFGYHTSTDSTTPAAVSSSTRSTPDPSSASSTSNTPSTTASGTPSADPSSSSSPSATPSQTSSPSNVTKTYTGSVADTRWGPVQVKITVTDQMVTKVDVVQYPNGNGRDAEINDYALPILVQETLSAQSSTIDMVSGATVTSDGYLQSLQAALDAVGI